MICQFCQKLIEPKDQRGARCLRVRSSGDIIWKKMHDFCLDLYLVEKVGFELVEGEERDRLLGEEGRRDADRKQREAQRKGQAKKTGQEIPETSSTAGRGMTMHIGPEGVLEFDDGHIKSPSGDHRMLKSYFGKPKERTLGLGDVARMRLSSRRGWRSP